MFVGKEEKKDGNQSYSRWFTSLELGARQGVAIKVWSSLEVDKWSRSLLSSLDNKKKREHNPELAL
jgi:hypothetical protein